MPLKVETTGESWGKWARKYPSEGRGIPIIYVIRADGQMLYGKSGPVPGENLSQFMVVHLSSAGRVLNDAEAELLTEAVATAKEAIDKGNTFDAVKSLYGTKKLGPLGEIGSFAKLAVEADQLVKQLGDEGKARLDEIVAKLSSGDGSFEDVLALAETKRNYRMLPALKAELATAARNVGKDAALREFVKPAETLDRALAYLTLPAFRARGIAMLKQTAARYAGTPAEKIAREKLDELNVSLAATAPLVAKTASSAGTASSSAAKTAAVPGPPSAKDRKKASSYLSMAKVFAAQRPEKAREYAQKIIDLVPHTREAREAQALIDRLK